MEDVQAVIHGPDEMQLEEEGCEDGSKGVGRTSLISSAELQQACLPGEENFSIKQYWKPELKLMLFLSLPCIAANTSTQVMVVTDQIFVGHIGVNEFAAAALGNTVRGGLGWQLGGHGL